MTAMRMARNRHITNKGAIAIANTVAKISLIVSIVEHEGVEPSSYKLLIKELYTIFNFYVFSSQELTSCLSTTLFKLTEKYYRPNSSSMPLRH